MVRTYAAPCSCGEPGEQPVDPWYGVRSRRREHRTDDHHPLALQRAHQPDEAGRDVRRALVEVVEAAFDDHDRGVAADRVGGPIGERHLSAAAGTLAEAGAGEPGHVHPAVELGRPGPRRTIESEADGVGVADHHDRRPVTGVLVPPGWPRPSRTWRSVSRSRPSPTCGRPAVTRPAGRRTAALWQAAAQRSPDGSRQKCAAPGGVREANYRNQPPGRTSPHS